MCQMYAHVFDIVVFIPPITVRMIRNSTFAEDDLLDITHKDLAIVQALFSDRTRIMKITIYILSGYN